MLAEVRLVIAPKEARLTVKRGDDVIEDEIWKFDTTLSRTEAASLAEVAFQDTYDLMQYSAYGDP